MTKQLTSENFSQLLQRFSADQNEAGVAYAKLRDSLVRFFEIKGDSYPDEAADETLDRVALKLSQNGEIDDLTKYSFGVARFIFLERIKANKKEKVAVGEFYADKTSFVESEETDDFAPFRECFARLADDDRKILRDYFSDIPFSQISDYRQNVSDKYKVSLNNLRIKVFRLRKRLENCVKRKLGK